MGVNCSNLTYADPSVEEYVWRNMGPRCVDSNFAIPAVTIYGIIFLLGLVGNMGTCIVIVKNKGMHTATNYYLFSLAVSDVTILLFGLPFEMHGVLATQYPYTMPEWLCKMRGFVTEFTSYASILCITAFSAERWLAICFPLKAQLFSKFSRAVKVIATAWTLAFVSAIPIFLTVKINRLGSPATPNTTEANITNVLASPSVDFKDGGATVVNTEFCALDHDNHIARSLLLNVSFYVFFVAPMLTITVLYLHIAVQLRNADRYLKVASANKRVPQTASTTRTSVLRILTRDEAVQALKLFAVVIAFFVCWLPFHLQRLSTIYVDWNNIDLATHNFFMTFYSVSGFFYYSNSAVNPLIYNIVSRKFRKAFICTILPKSLREHFKLVTGYDSQARYTTSLVSGTRSNRNRTNVIPMRRLHSTMTATGMGGRRPHHHPDVEESTAASSSPAMLTARTPTLPNVESEDNFVPVHKADFRQRSDWRQRKRPVGVDRKRSRSLLMYTRSPGAAARSSDVDQRLQIRRQNAVCFDEEDNGDE